MVALRLPIHVAQPVSLAASSCGTGLLSGPLLALAVAAASMLGNAYLDCPGLLWLDVRLLAIALFALAFALADDSCAIGSPTGTRRFGPGRLGSELYIYNCWHMQWGLHPGKPPI